MKFLEAIDKFERIRLPDWLPGYHLKKDGFSIVNVAEGQEEESMDCKDFESDLWEEFNPDIRYVNTREAFLHLGAGGRLYRTKTRSYQINEKGYIVNEKGSYVDPCWDYPGIDDEGKRFFIDFS